MIFLTDPSSSLQLTISGTLSCNCDYACSWTDQNFIEGIFVPGSWQSNTTALGTQLLTGAPAPGMQRQIKHISVTNLDASATVSVVVQKNYVGLSYSVTGTYALRPGWSLQYIDSRGFMVLDANGAMQYVGAPGAPATAGLVTGNFTQSGQEPEQRLTNTDDLPDEGIWRLHAEPGMLEAAAVNDDGSDAAQWLSVQRRGALVDTIAFEADSLTFNGFDLLYATPTPRGPYLPVTIGGQTVNLLTSNFAAAGGTASVPDNPIAKVGLAAVNGIAPTFMRSDAAPALDVSIAPVWTGLHKFNAGLTATTGAFSGALSASNLSGTNTGDQSLAGYATTGSLASTNAAVAANALAITANTNNFANYAPLAGAAFTGGVSVAGSTSLQSLTATNLSLSGTGSLLQLGSAKYAWLNNGNSQWAIDLGNGGGIRADPWGLIALNNNLTTSATGWTYKTASGGAEFAIQGGSFTWSTAPLGAAGAPATLTQVMSLSNAGGLALPKAVIGTGTPGPGSAGALPSAPVGYLQLSIAGTLRWIPFYA